MKEEQGVCLESRSLFCDASPPTMAFEYNKSSPFGRAHGDILSRVNDKDLQPDDSTRIVAELKSRGNAAFKAKRPEEAHLLYSAALHLDQQNFALFGNRSAVNEMMGKGDEALKDAQSATAIKPEWAKGFFRQGKAFACLKRYRESTTAYEQALSLEPDSKMLKKSVSKARAAELKAKEVAAAKANSDAEKKTKVVMAPPTVTSVTSSSSTTSNSSNSSSGNNDGADLSMKGYKKTKDGKTTSFFHMDIDDTAKALIGSIAPKKMVNAPVDDPELMAQGASAWNKGGTYEERNCNDWAESYLRAQLTAVQERSGVGSNAVTFTKINSFEGDCNVVLRQGKKRYVFDYEMTVGFDVLDGKGTVLGKGEWICNDFNSEAEGDCDVLITASSGKDQIKGWLKKKGIEEIINAVWTNFVTEYRKVH